MLGIFLQIAGSAGKAAQEVDVAGVGVLNPILAFLIVGLVIFAVLRKLKILGGFAVVDAVVAVIIGIIFAVNEGLRMWLLVVIPWFAVMLMVIFFLLTLLLFVCTKSVPRKFLVWVFLIIFIIIIVLSGIEAFSGGDVISYLPGPFFGYGEDLDATTLFFFSWLYSPRISGSILLIIAAVVMTWIMIKVGD